MSPSSPKTLYLVYVVAFLINLIWAAHPVVGKVLLAGWSPFHVAWMRYVSAWCVWMILSPFLKGSGKSLTATLLPKNRSGLIVMLVGAFTFCLSPLLQFSGLQKTGALENAILISLEPTSTVLLALIFLGERPKKREWWALFLAAFGVFVLSGGPSILEGGEKTFQMTVGAFGNILIVLSLLGEGFYSVAGRWLARDPELNHVSVFTRALSWGALFLSVIILPVHGLPDFKAFTSVRFLALFWIGPMGTALSYFIWLRLLEKVEVSRLAMSLFVQPLAGAAFGWAILGDTLTLEKSVGVLVIFFAMFLTANFAPGKT